MAGAINYVRREGRYVTKYYLVVVISIWRPPSDFEHKPQTRRKLAFNHILFTSSTDIALLFLNRKKRQCNKYVIYITKQSYTAQFLELMELKI